MLSLSILRPRKMLRNVFLWEKNMNFKGLYLNFYEMNFNFFYGLVNGFFHPPLPNLPELNKTEECLVAARLLFQQIWEITWFAGAKTFVGQVINVPVDPGSLLKVLLRKLSDNLILNLCVKKHIFHKSGPFCSLVNVLSLRKWLAYLAKSPLYKRWNLGPRSSWTANSDKKYMELNGVALNVNKPYVTSRKTAFHKDK